MIFLMQLYTFRQLKVVYWFIFTTGRIIVFMWRHRYNFPLILGPASLVHALTVLRLSFFDASRDQSRAWCTRSVMPARISPGHGVLVLRCLLGSAPGMVHLLCQACWDQPQACSWDQPGVQSVYIFCPRQGCVLFYLE